MKEQTGAFLRILVALLVLVASGRAAVNNAGDAGQEDKISELHTAVSKLNVTDLVVDELSTVDAKTGEKNVDKFASLSGEEPAEEDDIEETGRPGDEEYEGEGKEDAETETDEYADELRAAAESHEAMSRHDEQEVNRSNPSGGAERKLLLEDAAKKDFDSREKSVESGSDESEASNETILGGAEAKDEEVTELLKYKKKSRFGAGVGEGEDSAKDKRVPTVKKELSTQKEIKQANVSRVEKRFSTKEMLDELNKQFAHNMGNTEKACDAEASTSTAIQQLSEDLEEPRVAEVDDYAEQTSTADVLANPNIVNLDPRELTEPRKLQKRQEAVLRDLEAYLRAEYAAEQVQQQKLQDLGAHEGALAESLLELLVKLAENPRRWERVHRLLMDVEGGLELSRQALEARKRAFDATSAITTTTTTSPISTTPKKPRKKPKKKKKKRKQHRFSTSTTTLATTAPLITTTETPWLTTPVQWRLVAERLFGPPWSQSVQEDDPSIAKVRFTVPSSPRSSSSGREFVEQLGKGKQLGEHKGSEEERQTLESSGEYAQPRHLHYGKVNTHQGGGSHRQESSSGYQAKNRGSLRIREFDDPKERTIDFSGYSQYAPGSNSRDYNPRGRLTGAEYLPKVQNYAQNREYRPPGLEYAASKSWHDTQYKYGRPNWKSEERENPPPAKWSWAESQSDRQIWPQLEEPKTSWERQRDYWPRIQENDSGKVWSPEGGQSGGFDAWARIGGTGSWAKAPWGGQGGVKSYERSEGVRPPWEEGRGKDRGTDLGRAPLKQTQKEKIAPKITIKTWNSLTSDPATWPFKLTDTKPWPKDASGKSYNPNAALVRKLGLDNEESDAFDTNLIKEVKGSAKGTKSNKYKAVKSSGKIKPEENEIGETGKSAWGKQAKNYNSVDSGDRKNSWTNDLDTNPKIWPPKAAMSPKIQSVGAWVMPADQSTWKPYKLKTVESYGTNRGGGDAVRNRWNVQIDTNPRTWPPKITNEWNKFGKPSNTVTWPKWKQFAYHRVTAMPILSQGATLEGNRGRNNAYIAVSAVSSKYNGNQWRKNDIEEIPVSVQGPQHSMSHLRADIEPPIYTWKKDGHANDRKTQNVKQQNVTDPLEDQLETLRKEATWSHNENRDNIKKQLHVISDASETLASRFASSTTFNSSSQPAETNASSTKEASGPEKSPQWSIDRVEGKEVAHQ